MAKARAIDERRKAVNNIKKITRTMQLIATARYQQSLGRAVNAKPYTEKIAEVMADVTAAGADVKHPLLKQNPDVKREAILVLTSNRGLCGGYNANIIRAARNKIKDNSEAGIETDIYTVGKKGSTYFRFVGQELKKDFTGLPDAPEFLQVEPIATGFMDDYEAGVYSAVSIVYMKYLTAARQVPDCLKLLPIEQESKGDHSAGTPEGAGAASASRQVQYDFSPDPQALLTELLPVTVKICLFQCFNDAVVSENVARMVAMKSATDAASEMSKLLGQQFNRARQSQITTELLDIMGGVEALK